MKSDKTIFATWIDSNGNWPEVIRLAESLRTFGGKLATAPIRVYISGNASIPGSPVDNRLQSLEIEVRTSKSPEPAQWFYYAGKVYAAGNAEAEAEADKIESLVWMDCDTIVLDEPTDLFLHENISLAFCPVMHNRSGSLYDQPPDEFWSRIYNRLKVTDEMLYPMITPADRQKIRAYIHVGLMVVRPEKNILRDWVRDFEALYTDSDLAQMCRDDSTRRVFLHQTATTGAFRRLTRNEMMELSERYNYPIFFEKQYGGVTTYNSIENIVTVRCVVRMKTLGPDWHHQLTGPPDKIAWLKDHISP